MSLNMIARKGLSCLRDGRTLVPGICTAPRRCCVLTRAAQSVPGAANAPATDASVPEGHKGLHGSLYGEGGAEKHDGTYSYQIRKGEDDGSVLLPVDSWLEERDGEKPLGVYEIHNANGDVQYIGYARNMVTAVRGHLARVGNERCTRVRAMVFANRAMATREHVEREVAHWLEQAGTLPPGNGAERELWEGPSKEKVMSAAEQAEYAEKAIKMKLAMGEKGAETGIEKLGSPEDLKKAMTQGNWSEVIDRQTRTTTAGATATASGNGNGNGNGLKTAAGAPAARTPSPNAVRPPSPRASTGSPATAPDGSVVSPFTQASVHRNIGSTASVDSAHTPAAMTVEAVDQVLNEVRPYLMADGGDVEVVEVENGYIFLRLQGSCSTCASSQATMKMGIERALQAAFGDQLKDVIQVDKQDVITASVASVDMHLNTLRGAITNFGGKVEVLEVSQGTCLVRYQGPKPIGKGVQAAIKDRFPEIKEVILID